MNKGKTIGIAFLTGGLLIATPQVAEASTIAIELLAGNKKATIDMKVNGDLAKRLGFFARHRYAIDYENKASPFTQFNISYKTGKGLNPVLVTQITPEKGVDLRGAVEYMGKTGDFSIFSLVSTNLKNIENLTNVAYSPKLSKDLKGFVEIEAINHIGPESDGKDGHRFIGRARAGIEYKGFKGGFGVNAIKQKHSKKLGYNAGLFIRKSF